MATCARCGKKLGVFSNDYYYIENTVVCKDCSAVLEQEAKERKEQRRLEAEQRAKEISKIILTTGDLKEPYEILDTIIALDAHEAGYFSSAKPSTAFDGVKNQLRTIAYDMGADAVICCQKEQVELIWGRPKDVSTYTSIRGTNETWRYPGTTLYFDDGILTSWYE